MDVEGYGFVTCDLTANWSDEILYEEGRVMLQHVFVETQRLLYSMADMTIVVYFVESYKRKVLVLATGLN
jgi:hypothetical protein